MPRNLIVQQWISLDGYVTDRNDSLDFFTEINPQLNKFADEHQLRFLDHIDLIILGKKTYGLFVDYWPEMTNDREIISDRLNEIPKIIVSTSLQKAPWGQWPEAKVISENVVEKIRVLKKQNGKNIVLWGSISLCQLFMKENLIDEIHLRLCPVITGGGRKLFAEQDHDSQFDLREVKPYANGAVFLNYQLKK